MDSSSAATASPRRAEVECITAILNDVEDELFNALSKFEEFNSPHEGKAVIEEELDELWKHVKENTGRSTDAREEALQIAAMACRYIYDLCDKEHYAD